MQVHPLPPGGLDGGNDLQFFVKQRALYSLAQELAPQGVRLVVGHYQDVHDQLARHPKSVLPSLYLSGIYNAREAKGSPGNGDGLASHRVVDYLVARHQIDMIGPVLAIDGHTDHSLCRVHLALGPSAGEHRVQDRRDAVAAEDGDHFEVDRAV